MRRNRVRLNEAQLRRVIKESVYRILSEDEDMDEGWFGDKWKQTKSAWNTATQDNDSLSLGDRFSRAKKNWDSQGELNDLGGLRDKLSDLVQSRKIDPNTTVAQLIGGSMNGGRFGRMDSLANNRRSQISKRGGSFYQE